MTPSDPVVERVARAIWHAQWEDAWPRAGGIEHTHALEVAQAAIAALSPPPADSGVVEALEKCRDKFREYEGIHTLKLRDYKGKQPVNYAAEMQFKIYRNREMADMCDAALAKVRP